MRTPNFSKIVKVCSSSALLALVSLLIAGCSVQAKKSRHLSKAERYFVNQEFEKAKIEYLIVRKLEPTNSTAYSRLGRICLSQGSPLQALTYLVPARQLAPRAPEVLCAWGELFLGDGKLAEARQQFLETLQVSPTNISAILLLPYAASSPADDSSIEARLRTLPAPAQGSAAWHLAWATLYSRQNQAALAERSIEQALLLAPNMPEAHAGAAMMFISKSNFPAAEAEFRKAADLASAHSPIQLNYANFKEARGDKIAARAILKKIVQAAPDFLPAWDALARLDIGEQNFEEALSFTERVISQDPARFETFRLRSVIHSAMGNPQKAVQDWEQVDNRLKNLPAIRPLAAVQLAHAYVNNREPDKALRPLDEVLALSSNRLDATSIDAAILKGNVLLGQNRGAEVINSIGLLLQRTNYPQARLLMVDAYRQVGRSDEAVRTLRGLTAEYPKDPHLAYTLGILLREQKKFTEARQAFQRSRDLATPNPGAVNQLIELDLQEGNYARALKLVQEEQATTNSAPLKYREGTIYAARKQNQEAETAFMKALELDPFFSSPYYALAGYYVENKKQEQAIQDLETLLAKKTNDFRALMLCAMLYTDVNQPQKARVLLERALKIDPRFAPALNNLAYIASEKLGSLEEGYGFAKKARNLDPGDPGIADTLGWILYKKEDYQQALPLLRQAAQERPQNPDIQYHLGMTCYLLGQTDAAKAALERAVAASANFSGRTEALRRLALLNGGSTGQSIAELEASLKSQPKDVSTRMRLAGMYETSGDPKKAAEKYEEVFRINPQSSGAAFRLGLLNSGPLQNSERALQWAQKSYDLAPQDPEAMWLLGRLLFNKGEYTRSHALLNVAARQMPTRADVLYDFSWAAYSIGRLSESEQFMRQALLSPSLAAPQAAEARRLLEFNALLAQPQNLKSAEGKIEQTLTKAPDYVPALFLKAALQRQRNDLTSAINTYEIISKKYPEFTPAARELALLLASDPGSQERAYQLAFKSHSALPDDLDLTRALGILAFQRRDYPFARSLLEQVSSLRPQDPEVLFRLGLVHLQMKDTLRAKQALRQALALNLTGDLEKRAKEELVHLQ